MHKFVAAKAVLGLIIAAGLTVLGLAMAPAAAADETGPNSVACAQAGAAVFDAARAANAKAVAIEAGQSEIIADLKAKVSAAQSAYDAVYAKYQADPPTASLDDLQDAQDALNKALDALENAPGVPATQKTELAALQAALKVAIDKSEKACNFQALPTVTVTPSPPVTVTVTPTPRPTVTGIDTGLA